MKKEKRRVFLTGATGVMGQAGLKELVKEGDRYEVTVLARPSRRNRKKLKKFREQGVKVVWGDLMDEKSLREGIEGADIVLHVGGMVSPMAEHYPEKTLRVNIGSMRLITKIIKEMEEREGDRSIGLVYIGSVSQYGSHLPPDHWGKTGDPMMAAKLDAYAVSKIIAERVMVESGLKRWVSLRQTSILHPGLLKKANDPVAFHVPLNGVLEWVSVEDSGRLLEKVCREEYGEGFWNNYYNVGGGEKMRLTNLEFERGILKATGCPAPEKVFEPDWFALDNFHGIWFEDSDYLDSLLQFRKGESFEEIIGKMKKELPFYFHLAPLVPAGLIKNFMKRVASKPGLGPLSWLATDDKERINAAWGSRERHSEIGGWEKIEEQRPEPRKVPQFIPGEAGSLVLSGETCPRGHYYHTSEALRSGGHGCPYCVFIDSKVPYIEEIYQRTVAKNNP